MTELLYAVIGILLAVIAALLVKIHGLRKAAREITDGFAKRLTTDTNTLIDISSGDRQMRQLAGAVNTQLRLLREQRLQYLNGDQELKEAVSNISHDLRTPLTAIWGYLELLEKAEMSADAARYVGQIRNRVEALKQMTEELFRYSVISSVPEVNLEQVDMRRALEESLLSFYGAMQQSGITPQIQLPEKAVWRNLDPTALSRVFGNVIGNAIKYSDGDFCVTMEENGMITFSNTAAGLSRVDAEKLFNRFFTVDSARKSTGLGLSIAKLLVERMNGRIWAEHRDNMLRIFLVFPDA